jgi:hypothetical protein
MAHGPIRKLSTEALILIRQMPSAEGSIEWEQDAKENRDG